MAALQRQRCHLLGVDLDEPAEKVQGLVEATGVTYPCAWTPEARCSQPSPLPKAGVTRNVVVDQKAALPF